MNPIQVWRNWRSRAELMASWGLSPTDLVLEVGSGQNPSPRADVLCERYVADGTERHDALPRVDRPLVVGDIARLPFRDNAFDFVVCTHVLEHVADPSGAIGELTRVARRGYVETPAAAWEHVHSFTFHRWYVSEEEGVMVFRAKTRAIHDEVARGWMRGLLELHPGLMDWIIQNEVELGTIVGIVWSDDLPHRVEGTPAPETAADEAPENDDGFTGAVAASRQEEIDVLLRASELGRRTRSLSDGVYRAFARHARRASSGRVDLASLVQCPVCGAPLRPASSTEWACDRGHRFDAVDTAVGSIPFLLAPDA